MTSGVADDALRCAEAQAKEHHINATSSCPVGDQGTIGLRPRPFFTALSRNLVTVPAKTAPRPIGWSDQ